MASLDENPATLLEFDSGNISQEALPTYLQQFSEEVRLSILQGWEDELSEFQNDESRNALILSRPDGLRVVAAKVSEKVLLCLTDSSIRNRDYLEWYLLRGEVELDSADAALEEIPKFGKNLIKSFLKSLEDAGGDQAEMRQIGNELSLMVDYYEAGVDSGDASGIDIRMFAMLHSLRLLLKEFKISVLAIRDSVHADVATIYSHETSNTFAPDLHNTVFIGDASARSKLEENMRAQQHELVPLSTRGESMISSIVPYGRIQKPNPEEPSWTGVVSHPEIHGKLLVEIVGTGLTKNLCLFVEDALRSSMDPQPHTAVDSLKDRATLATSAEKKELLDLAKIYSRGFREVEGDRLGERCPWYSLLDDFREHAMMIGVQALSPRAIVIFKEMIDVLKILSSNQLEEKKALLEQKKAELQKMILLEASTPL